MKIKKNRPSVSVVIPTYNGRHLLQRHLPHVLGSMSHGDELVIVDDSSNDETLMWLAQEFKLTESEVKIEAVSVPEGYYPDLKKLKLKVMYGKSEVKKGVVRIVVLGLTSNLRFAGAANVGLLLSSHSLVFLINNDVSPVSGVLEQLANHFEDNEVFAVGCHEFKAEDIDFKRTDTASNSEKFQPLEISSTITNNEEGSGRNVLKFERGLFTHSKHSEMISGETAWAVGGSSMFDRLKWLSLGGLDKKFYPAYWEDIDLSFRAKKLGWKVLFDQDAIVIHQHETTNQQVFGQKQIKNISWKNANKFTMKNGNLWQKIQHLIYMPIWMWRRYREQT